MNKMTQLWLRCTLLGLFGVLLSVVWPPTIAEAHNCGDFLDCYDTLRAAVSATVGLTTFAVILSVGLDFVPGVGQGKGIIEAATGRDLITGEELKTHERLLGILGPAGRIASVGSSTVRGMARGGRHADSGGDAARSGRQDSRQDVTGGTRHDTKAEFSIINWDGYPKNGPKPGGPFRLLEGKEYTDARKAANNANRRIHKEDPSLKGKQIHEIHPVKFGGSPSDKSNKIPLSPKEHAEYTKFWNKLMRNLKK